MIGNELHSVCLNEESGVLAGMGCGRWRGRGGVVIGVPLSLSPSLPHLPVLIATNLGRLWVVLITVEELSR